MIPTFSPDIPLDIQLDQLMRRARRLAAAGKKRRAIQIWRHVLARTPASHRSGRWIDEARGSLPSFPATLRSTPKTRVYVLGCGRSGTWLTLAMMGGFRDTYIAPDERHFGHFVACIDQPESVHVVKRTHYAHATMVAAPQEIGLLYVLRDPRDVLTSKYQEREFYITMERWTAEMESLEAVLATERPNLLVTRFEDLVRNPQTEQARIADAFGLEVDWPADRFHERFEAGDELRSVMQGLRPPDTSVIGRWRTQPSSRAHLEAIREPILATFSRLGERFGYDLSDF